MNAKLLLLALLLCLSAFALDPGGDSSTGTGSPPQETPEELLTAIETAADSVSAVATQMITELGITSTTCDPPRDAPIEHMGPAMIILMILAAGLAIFYMAGNFLNSPQIIAMAKQEGFELVHTVLIVLLFFSLYAFAQNVLGTIGAGPDDIYDKAMEYSMIMFQKITKDIFWLAAFNTLVYMFYSAPLRMGGALHMAIHFNLGGILKPLVDGVGTMASLLSFAAGEWIVNLAVLCYIKRYMLSLLLPIGILLKALPQTRGGGNAIIAISIAFFMIYPLMLVMNYQAYEYKYGLLPERSGVGALVTDFLRSSGYVSLTIYAVFMLGMVKTIPGLLAISWVLNSFLDLYTDVIYTVFVLSIFLPLLNIFITFTFAREIAKYFGTEINIAAFAKMV
ncbi:MAG: hypothetical protein GY852_04300 [bacterium]|nr:hypothetical protein [bacterium]